MSTPPRRRRPAAPNSKGEGGGWLPTIAMGIGVVVAGLGIGALIAVLMQRSNLKAPVASAPVVVVTSTPATDLPTRGPIAIATLASPRTPRPSPPPSAAPARTQPTSSPSAASSPTPAPPTAMPPTATPSTATAPTPSPPTPKPSAKIAAVTPALTARPSTPRATPEPQTAQATPTPAATTASVASAGTPTVASAGAPSSYDEHASSVVRRYLDALIRGDEKSAYTALGGAGGTLSEQAFLDPGSRIVSIKVTRIDASNASVGCEIAAAKGHYYATFHVTAASSGPYIAQHDFIKV